MGKKLLFFIKKKRLIHSYLRVALSILLSYLKMFKGTTPIFHGA
jgi:hypothetical protein